MATQCRSKQALCALRPCLRLGLAWDKYIHRSYGNRFVVANEEWSRRRAESKHRLLVSLLSSHRHKIFVYYGVMQKINHPTYVAYAVIATVILKVNTTDQIANLIAMTLMWHGLYTKSESFDKKKCNVNYIQQNVETRNML